MLAIAFIMLALAELEELKSSPTSVSLQKTTGNSIMTAATHPLAPHGLPSFIGGADGSDPLFTAVVFILIAGLMGVAVLYFKLHSIPEHLAQKQNNGQTQLIMVLAVLALPHD